jgi:acyl carrier protein
MIFAGQSTGAPGWGWPRDCGAPWDDGAVQTPNPAGEAGQEIHDKESMTMATADYTEIYEQLKSILGRFLESPVTIGEETELVNDLQLDSLKVMEIVEEVEDTFDFSFPLNELSGIRTVKDFVLRIQQEIAG